MKSKSPLFSNYSIRRSASADVSYMSKGNDRFAKFASRRKDIDPDGWYDVIAHGNPKSMIVRSIHGETFISARQAAAMIRKQPGFKKAKRIRLLSCSTGQDPTGFAQHLANALGKPVMAPNKTLWCSPKGTLYVSSDERNLDKGSFVTFKPGGIKHGK